MKPTIFELKFYYNSHKREDNSIDFADFLTIIHDHSLTENANQEILDAFRAYDLNKSGYLTIKELRNLLTMTGERLSAKDGNLIFFSLFARLFFFYFMLLKLI
jgi:Ca2+-binding EF-hand superfamily protein